MLRGFSADIETIAKVTMTIMPVTKTTIPRIDEVIPMGVDMVIGLVPGPIRHVSYFCLGFFLVEYET